MAGQLKKYSIQEKRGACTAFCILGSYKQAGEEVGISERTIAAWAKKDWWEAWVEQITEELGKQLLHKMRGVALEAYNQQLERLDNGDIKVLADGTVVRVPITFKDLNQGANVTTDKLRLGEGKSTSRVERVGTLDDLAAEFEKIAAQYGKNIKDMGVLRPIISGEVVSTQSAALPGDKR